MGKEDIVIECIAEESFNNFCEIVDATSILRQDKQIVIFGAGIMGMQFAYTLQQLGINNFIYPFLAAFFHICFINIGNFIAINIIKNFKISQKHLSIISGAILVIIAIARIIAK